MTWPNAAVPVRASWSGDGVFCRGNPLPRTGTGVTVTSEMVLRALTHPDPRPCYLLSPESVRWMRDRLGLPPGAPLALGDVAEALGVHPG